MILKTEGVFEGSSVLVNAEFHSKMGVSRHFKSWDDLWPFKLDQSPLFRHIDTIDYCLFLSELHLVGLETATPSSSACGRVTPAQTPVPSAPTWRVLFLASSWKSDMRTFCSTSCPLTPAAWLVSLMRWPTTTRSWASPTSLFPRPPWTRWGDDDDDGWSCCRFHTCVERASVLSQNAAVSCWHGSNVIKLVVNRKKVISDSLL